LAITFVGPTETTIIPPSLWAQRTPSSCTLSATAMVHYTIHRQISKTFTAEWTDLMLTLCIATCAWCLYFTCRML